MARPPERDGSAEEASEIAAVLPKEAFVAPVLGASQASQRSSAHGLSSVQRLQAQLLVLLADAPSPSVPESSDSTSTSVLLATASKARAKGRKA